MLMMRVDCGLNLEMVEERDFINNSRRLVSQVKKPIRFLNHEEATEAFNNGEAVKMSSTLIVICSKRIKMKDSMYIVESRMPSYGSSHYEVVSQDEYEAV